MNMKKLILLLMVTAMALTASAYDFMVNGIAYNYLDGSMGSEVEVTYTSNSVLNYGDTLYFAGIPTKVTYVGRTYSVTAIGNCAFEHCTHIRSVYVPYSVKSIGSSAFRGCSMLSTVTIGDYVTSIGDYAFKGCSKLATVAIGASVTSIGKEAFTQCYDLASVTIPNSVTSIGDHAFYNCQGLTSLTIGNSVTSIGKWAFYKCNALTSIKSKIIDVGAVSMGDAVFGGVSTTSCVLKIPTGTYDIYRQTPQWKDFKNIQEGVISNILVSSITLNRTSATMNCNTNGHLQLTATVLPVDADNRTVFWSSDNTSVATVNPTGEVFAVGPGVAHIKARAQDGSGVSATCTITVESQLVESITLNRTSAAIYDGQTLQLTATVSPDYANNKTLAWTSNNTSIASVDNNGLVTAHSPGTAYINATATDGSNVTARCIVVVMPQLVESITLNSTEVSLFKGNTYQLTATVLPNTATDKSVTWTSNNTNVATVNDNGLVTAISPGTATIIVVAQDGSGVYTRCTVTVTPKLVTNLTLNRTSASIYTGQTLQLTATVTPDDADDKTVAWASSNTNVATVDDNGLVTAISPGTARIAVAAIDGSGVTATCTVTVNALLATGITLNQTSATLNNGETLQLTATVTPSNAYNKAVTWTSSNTSVATVSNNGLVTAKGPGTATIKATTADGSNLSATCSVNVNGSSYLPGDVDGNGNVDGSDLNILINIILGKDNAANYDGRANVDGNGSIDGSDINSLINILLGK